VMVMMMMLIIIKINESARVAPPSHFRLQFARVHPDTRPNSLPWQRPTPSPPMRRCRGGTATRTASAWQCTRALDIRQAGRLVLIPKTDGSSLPSAAVFNIAFCCHRRLSKLGSHPNECGGQDPSVPQGHALPNATVTAKPRQNHSFRR
jgi:hypothetical protein